MNLPLFKIHASAAGKIMTNDRSGKNPGKTCIDYLHVWAKEQLYARKKDTSSKYTEKGIIVEQDSIDFIADMLGLGFTLKNEQTFENSHITGTPDIITDRIVIDAKSSWDCFTFPLFESEPNDDYIWQLQCYMELTGLREAILAYVLMDTPYHLIERAAKFHALDNGYSWPDKDILSRFVSQMTYSHIPNDLRIKTYQIKYDPVMIGQLYTRVDWCRNYLDSL